MKKWLARLLLLIGIFLIIYGSLLLWHRYNPKRLSFMTKQIVTQTKQIQKAHPVAINIPKKHINLPLIPAKVTNGSWETTDKGISYLSSSPIPGETGNSIFYGHNWTNLFGRLVEVIPGDEVEITMDDGSKQIFTIVNTSIVTPETVDILKPSTDKRITMYTCTGFLDSHRFVAVAIKKDKITLHSNTNN